MLTIETISSKILRTKNCPEKKEKYELDLTRNDFFRFLDNLLTNQPYSEKGHFLEKNAAMVIVTAIQQIIASTDIDSITLSGWGFSPKDQLKLLSTSLANRKLRTIILLHMALTPKSFLQLGEHPSLQKVLIDDCKVVDDLAARLLARSQSLKSITLRYNYITDMGILELCKIKTLEYFDFGYGYAGIDGFLSLIASGHIKELKIGEDLDEFSAKKLQEAAVSSSLDSFELTYHYGASQTQMKAFKWSRVSKPSSSSTSAFRYKIITGEKTGMPCMNEFDDGLSGEFSGEDPFDTYTGEDLRRALLDINYNPNTYSLCYDRHGQVNPVLNCEIANEHYWDAMQIICVFPELDPNLRDYQGKTALIIAAKAYGADDLLRALIKHHLDKINLNAQDEDGCTALHYLCAYGKLHLVQLLLSAGADYSLQDKKGRIAFEYANMSVPEIREMLDAIALHPDRDALATHNQFIPITLKEGKPSFIDGFLVYSKENLENALQELDESGFCLAYPVKGKRLQDEYLGRLKSFSGKSIVETALEERQKLKQFISNEPSLCRVISAPILRSFGLAETHQTFVMQYLYQDFCQQSSGEIAMEDKARAEHSTIQQNLSTNKIGASSFG